MPVLRRVTTRLRAGLAADGRTASRRTLRHHAASPQFRTTDPRRNLAQQRCVSRLPPAATQAVPPICSRNPSARSRSQRCSPSTTTAPDASAITVTHADTSLTEPAHRPHDSNASTARRPGQSLAPPNLTPAPHLEPIPAEAPRAFVRAAVSFSIHTAGKFTP